MSKRWQLRNLLESGPYKTADLAALLGWTTKITFAHLQAEMAKGRASRERFEGSNGRVKWLWRKKA